MASTFRMIFGQPMPADVSRSVGLDPRRTRRTVPKLGPYMDEAKAEVLAFTGFPPREHWRKI